MFDPTEMSSMNPNFLLNLFNVEYRCFEFDVNVEWMNGIDLNRRGFFQSTLIPCRQQL